MVRTIAADSKLAYECHHQGCAHLQQRQLLSAVEQFEQALTLGLDPLIGVAERWRTWMLLGEFERAWQETDRIEALRSSASAVDGTLCWNGADFNDRTVLLRHDHGLGDAIQFIRYAPLIKQRCSRLIVKARPILIPLLQTLQCIDEVASAFEPDPAFDVQMEAMELPYIFRTTLDSIPSDIPYLHLNCTRVVKEPDTLKVGLAWASGPWNSMRSISLDALRPLGQIPNVSFHSLQWGGEWRQAIETNHGLSFHNRAVAPPEDLIATAETILGCDVVITVDTMAAHLAGALGKPVWILLHFDSDWRWMADRSDSPWYPTMRIFRQQSDGDWSIPVQALAAYGADYAAQQA
jgi:hypothetical protein